MRHALPDASGERPKKADVQIETYLEHQTKGDAAWASPPFYISTNPYIIFYFACMIDQAGRVKITSLVRLIVISIGCKDHQYQGARVIRHCGATICRMLRN